LLHLISKWVDLSKWFELLQHAASLLHLSEDLYTNLFNLPSKLTSLPPLFGTHQE
jgi:hypothetical protein